MRIGVLDSGQKIITSGLVLHLDAAQLRSYSGSGSTWTDISGNGKNGTLTNNPSFDSSNGGSISFNSTSSQYILGSSPPVTAIPLTICAWVRVTSDGSRAILSIQEKTNSHRCQLYLFNRTIYGTAIGTGAGGNAVTTSSISLNTWAMATFVISSSTSRTVYLNDAQNSGTNTVDSGSQNAFTEFTIGARFSTSYGFYYNGNVAIALVYNRVLSTTEITQNYNALKSRFGL